MKAQILTANSWNVRFAIPKGVLAALHTKQPTARLHATNLSRRQSSAYIPLDTNLLPHNSTPSHILCTLKGCGRHMASLSIALSLRLLVNISPTLRS